MGKTSLRKGKKGEYEFRKLCESKGFKVVWQAEDPTQPDVRLENLECEIKYGSHIPKKIYQWMSEKQPDILALRRVSNKDKGLKWLIVMSFDDFQRFLKVFKLK